MRISQQSLRKSQQWGRCVCRVGGEGSGKQEGRGPACALSCMVSSRLCMCPQALVSWPYSLSQRGHLSQWFSKYDPTPVGSAVPGDLLAIPNFRPYPNPSNQKLLKWDQKSMFQQALQVILVHWKVWELLINLRVTEVRGPATLRLPLKWILALNSFKLGQTQDSMTEKEHSEQLGGRTWHRK